MKKILIVDDLRPFIEQERSILSRADFRIFTAATSEEALAIHRTEGVDLIVTDLDMPGIPGDELCRKVREDPGLKRVSIIIVCTKKRHDLERCAESGANSYLTRPINPEELREKATSLLEIPVRKHIRVLSKVTVKGRFKTEPFFCSSHDISVSGILLETEKILARGDIISCSFFLPNGEERIVTDGEVIRVVKKGHVFQYGVRFVGLELGYAHAIKRYVAKKSTRAI